MALQTIPYDFADVVISAASRVQLITGSVFYAPAGTKAMNGGRRLRDIELFAGTIALRGPGVIDVTAYVEANIANAPADGDWSIADSATATQATVTISGIPVLNGGTLVKFQWSKDAGATWTDMVRITAGTEDIVLGAAATYNVLLRAVTRHGEGLASASKAVTVV